MIYDINYIPVIYILSPIKIADKSAIAFARNNIGKCP